MRSVPVARVSAALAALVTLAGCTPAPPPAPAAPTYDYTGRADQLDIIFISMDAMRFDHTGAGGAHLTPNLDAFASESVVFTHTTSAAPWTVPSHMAMFTGRWPTLHGVTNKLKPGENGELVWQSLREDIKTFPQTLTEKGWKAAAFTGGAGVSAKFGYGRGFETYLDDKPFAGMDYSGPPAVDWLRAHAGDHFFLFFHGYDVHGQHPLLGMDPRAAVPDYHGTLDGSIEEQAKLREQGLAAIKNPGDAANLDGVVSAEDARFLLGVYDAKVKEADARLGQFLAVVKELGLYDRAIIVVVGDHGEEFMEHHYIDHGATLCEHQLHVPMMIHFPGGEGAKVVADPVRTIDVMPTVFDALGLPGPDGVSGQSLLPILRGGKLDLPLYAETDYRLFVHQRMMKQGPLKLILDLEDGKKELFDLNKDPNELQDLSETDTKDAYEMEQGVRTWLGSMNTDPGAYLNIQEEHIKTF